MEQNQKATNFGLLLSFGGIFVMILPVIAYILTFPIFYIIGMRGVWDVEFNSMATWVGFSFAIAFLGAYFFAPMDGGDVRSIRIGSVGGAAFFWLWALWLNPIGSIKWTVILAFMVWLVFDVYTLSRIAKAAFNVLHAILFFIFTAPVMIVASILASIIMGGFVGVQTYALYYFVINLGLFVPRHAFDISVISTLSVLPASIAFSVVAKGNRKGFLGIGLLFLSPIFWMLDVIFATTNWTMTKIADGLEWAINPLKYWVAAQLITGVYSIHKLIHFLGQWIYDFLNIKPETHNQ